MLIHYHKFYIYNVVVIFLKSFLNMWCWQIHVVFLLLDWGTIFGKSIYNFVLANNTNEHDE